MIAQPDDPRLFWGAIGLCSSLAGLAHIFGLPRAAHLPMLSGYGRHVSGMV
jgi:hypothetical protein